MTKIVTFYFMSRKEYTTNNPGNLGLRYFPHCLEMNYFVDFLGGIGGNRFHIKWIFGTQDTWKN